MQQRALLNPPPAALAEQCIALGLPVSGNAAGHNSTTDLSGWYEGPYLQDLGWHGKGIGAMFGYVSCLFFIWSIFELLMRNRCVLTAVLGMLSVAWYSLGGHISEEEMEAEERIKAEKKARLQIGRAHV